jgi:NAD(P)H-hydrate epimerase
VVSSEVLWTLPEDFSDYPPPRPAAAHKGTCGHLALFAGSLGYHGAAVLAARGAQRAQPGLITLFALETVYPVIASQLQAVMVSPWRVEKGGGQDDLLSPALSSKGGEGEKPNRRQEQSSELRSGAKGHWSAILAGPGLAAGDVPEGLKAMTRQLWRESPLPMVVDATALGWLAQEPARQDALRVLTPHPGEAAGLLGSSAKQVQANRLAALREVSRRFGNSWVVLKGHQTLVGRSMGEVYVNSSGNPHLAQGGSGDVLSGYLAGLLAQPALQADALQAIRYAVWQHGATADSLQARRRNWVVEDLVEGLGDSP